MLTCSVESYVIWPNKQYNNFFMCIYLQKEHSTIILQNDEDFKKEHAKAQ